MSGPIVVAHRGSSEALPEHTLGAYLRAIDEGADALECDVRLTRDRKLVCIHDRWLSRTSDGQGRVSTSTLEQLERLDFGGWHPGQAATATRAGVLTFERLLEAALGAGRPVRLLVETKHPTRYDGAVEREVVRVLARYGVGGAESPVPITLMSFSALAVARFRRLAPQLPAVFLIQHAIPLVRSGRAPFGAAALGPGVAILRRFPRLVELAHRRGHQVYCWTADTPADVDLLLERGVDAIITNRPAYVLSRLGRG
jgi:glycerophosphoryl diester phosphodiesterase